MAHFLPHTEESRNEILNSIGIKSIENLIANIPEKIRIKGNIALPEPISEMKAAQELKALSETNIQTGKAISFLGGGCYNRYVPACILEIVQRSEFLTSYTPYQPEVSQGTLQVMYEYQSMICNLTGMDVANASVYDGATACAEAILMAARITNKTKVLISDALNPDYKEVIKTYLYGADIEITFVTQNNGLTEIPSNVADYACILIQNPNYLGRIEENIFEISELCKANKVKLIACIDPVSLSLISNPTSYNADIVVGDVQPLGIPMSFGGPHGGFIACKNEYVRQLPGRIAGMTLDKECKRAFTLTLQAREQHIRRSKATSNICSNQALMALWASIYMSVMGEEGIKEIASISSQKAHYLATEINKINGLKVPFEQFLYEFPVIVDEKINLETLLQEMEKDNIFAGINLKGKFDGFENAFLVCTTEMTSDREIELFLNKLKALV